MSSYQGLQDILSDIVRIYDGTNLVVVISYFLLSLSLCESLVCLNFFFGLTLFLVKFWPLNVK